MRRTLWILVLALGCSSSGGPEARAQLASVSSWCCWLQAPDVDALAASPYEVVVMDYSRDGGEAGEFASEEITRLRDAGKTALAYLSIGEAEDYRFYWQEGWGPGGPGFLADENPDWPGNFAVAYWTEEWWGAAVEPYLDRILAQGFDGVYLDRIDAYAWWHERRGMDARLAADRMAALVERIARHARGRAGATFIVCPQNGLSILDDASAASRRRYVDAIDAVGVESLFFNSAGAADEAYRLAKLAELQAAGKRILLLEYIDPADRPALAGRIAASGLAMVAYAAAPDRLLDELVLAP